METYSNFVKEVDTFVMEWKSYYQIVTELSPTEWIYHNLKSYIVTHNEVDSDLKEVINIIRRNISNLNRFSLPLRIR